MNEADAATGKSMTTMWLLIAICAFPVVASWFLYFNPGLLPAQRGNRGELIQPPRPVPSVNLYTINGQQLTPSSLHGYWTLVTLGGNSCDKVCQQHIHDIRQIRLALGKEMYHIQRLLVLTRSEQPDEFLAMIAGYPGMHVVTGGDTAFDSFLSVFGKSGEMDKDVVYLIDPMGNLMMRYRPGVPAKDILKDLERLLKATKHWIGQSHPDQI